MVCSLCVIAYFIIWLVTGPDHGILRPDASVKWTFACQVIYRAADVSVFELLLKKFKNVIDANVLPGSRPLEATAPSTSSSPQTEQENDADEYTKLCPAGTQCTMFMSLCANELNDTMPFFRVFIEVFPTEIDAESNHFSSIVLNMCRLRSSVLE